MTSPVSQLLEVRSVSKEYGGVPALDDVSMTVNRGAVHGVLGKNGAGKSTLMGVIAGSVNPSAGRILVDGVDVTDLSLSDRKRLGVHLMEQHAEVFGTLSVAENLALPHPPRRAGMVDWRAVRRNAQRLLEKYGLDIAPERPAGLLNLPDQRKLALVKTLSDNGKLAILDEPTTAMSREERAELFTWIRGLTAEGLTFLYITHFNRDLIELCDEYTVLRDGRVSGSGGSMAGLSSQDLSRLVTGANVTEFSRERRSCPADVLRVSGVRVQGSQPVSFRVGKGEIVGLVGLPGSGAREIARGIAGLVPIQEGDVIVHDEPVRSQHPADAIRAGIAYLPNDRIAEGLVAQFSVQENLHVGNWPSSRVGFLRPRIMRGNFDESRKSFGIRTAGPGQLISKLSGGNQQKTLLGRLIHTHPSVLILDEPTAGVDVEAKEDVHRLIDALTSQGVSVMILAYDPGELVRLVDRALVFRDGELVTELNASRLTDENVLSDISHAHSTK